MKTLSEIKRILISHRGEIEQKYGVKEIGIFGSYARGDTTETSDVDILVEFRKPVGLLKIMNLQNYLSDILGIKVDIVVKESIREELKDNILKEAIYL